MRKGDVLGGYVLTTDGKQAGHSEWALAEKDGTENYIKRFLAPTYPVPGAPGSEKTKRARRARCQAFEEHHQRIMNALKPISGAGGNLVTTEDFFRYGAHYYKVTAKIDVSGIEPKDIAGMPLASRILVMLTACHSLGTLHAAGLVHGDVKPGNVLIKQGRKGFVTKIIDFDNCFVAHAPPPRKELVGDPAYYSPELLHYIRTGSDPNLLGVKSDVFALGLLFWQYLTGALPPLPAGYPYAASAVRDHGPLSLHSKTEHAGLVELISQMLAPSPDQRPNMKEVHTSLKLIQRPLPPGSARGGRPTGDIPGSRKNGKSGTTVTETESSTGHPEGPRLRGPLVKRGATGRATPPITHGKLVGSLLKKKD